jgi:DNA polymerase III delta subunit
VRIIKEPDFRKEIKTKPECGYLFFGEEDYMKSFALSCAIEAISPDSTLSFFNEMKLDALSYSPDALREAMMPFPMGADRKLITVSGLDISAMKQGELDALCSVLSELEEYDYNTVIITVAADRFDPGILPKRPSTTLQKLCEHLTAVNFEKNSPARLAAWVGKHYEHNGVSATPEICALTVERCGRDMFKLAGETDKVSFYVLSHGKRDVTAEDVINVALPAAEYDAFAFTNAIGSRQKELALDILADMKLRRMDPLIIMGEVSRAVCDICAVTSLAANGATAREISDLLKIHEYRVSLILKNGIREDVCKNMLERLRLADLENKSGKDGYYVIEKLICTL